MRRQRLHRRVADTLEQLHAGNLDEYVSDLAYHLTQAGARERAAKYLQQAGNSAMARLATPEALALFARAAELADPGPSRWAALRTRGELLLGLFRGREAAADLEVATREAAEQGATAEEMEALLRLGRAYYVVGLDHRPAIAQSLDALERARQLAVQLGDRHGEARALIPTHRHVDFDPGFKAQATENENRALAIARELGDEEMEIDALRGATRMGTIADRLANIERIATALERRGDLIALNEHHFNSIWTYWRAGRFTDCVTCCDRATNLAERLGIPPVQYGTIKSFALVDLGHLDAAWEALGQEVVDDAHPFGQVFQGLGQMVWYSNAGDFDRVIHDIPRVYTGARELQRVWMIPWLDNLLALAIVQSKPDGTGVATVRAAVEAAGGHLADEALVAALLRAGDAEAALTECARRLPMFEAEGHVRNLWLTEELRIRALLALGGFAEARDAAGTALDAIGLLAWGSLLWRVHASLAAALEELGDDRAAVERRAATERLMAVAGTLNDGSVRSRFLESRAAAELLG